MTINEFEQFVLICKQNGVLSAKCGEFEVLFTAPTPVFTGIDRTEHDQREINPLYAHLDGVDPEFTKLPEKD